MYELKKLWRGQISPSERFIHEDSQYWKISQKHGEVLQELYALLSPEAQKRYEEAEQLFLEMQGIDTEEAFIQGFWLGARLILDAVMDYRSTFCSLAEKRAIEK